MAERDPVLTPVDQLLVEVYLEGQFTSDLLPAHQGNISGEDIFALLGEPVRQFTTTFVWERCGYAANQGHGYETIAYTRRLVEGIGIALDTIAPLAKATRGELFPDAYQQWVEQTGPEYAREKAGEQIGWAEWIETTCRQLAYAVAPEAR